MLCKLRAAILDFMLISWLLLLEAHQSPAPKPQQRWREVQFATGMGQLHQEESGGRQAEERGEGRSRHHCLAQCHQQHR